MSKKNTGFVLAKFSFNEFEITHSEVASIDEDYHRTVAVIAPDINYLKNSDGRVTKLSWESKQYKLRIYSDRYDGNLLIDYNDFKGGEPNGWEEMWNKEHPGISLAEALDTAGIEWELGNQY